MLMVASYKYSPRFNTDQNACGTQNLSENLKPANPQTHPLPTHRCRFLHEKALFEGHPNLGMLATPLLLFHPLELILGSALAPWLRSRAETREKAAAVAGS